MVVTGNTLFTICPTTVKRLRTGQQFVSCGLAGRIHFNTFLWLDCPPADDREGTRPPDELDTGKLPSRGGFTNY